MSVYLDTSAAMKLLVEEPESQLLAEHLAELEEADRVVASWLLHTELHCASARRGARIRRSDVDAVLAAVTLIDLTRADLLDAPRRGAGLCSQDAIHLAVAMRVGADSIITYDTEQAAAADAVGLRVLAPDAAE